MKQKQVKPTVKAEKQGKSVRKMEPPKKMQKMSAGSDDEDDVVAYGIKVTKIPVPRKAARGKKVVEESDGEQEEVAEEIVALKKGGKKKMIAKGKKVVKESDDEKDEDVEETVVAKKQTKKMPVKGKKVVVEESEEEEDEQDDADQQEEDDDDHEDNEQDDEDVEQEEQDEDEPEDEEDEPEDEEDEPEDNEEDGDGDEGENGDEDNEESTNSDEEGEGVHASPSKVLTGPLKFDYTPNQCIHVTKLPKKCKQIDIIEAFAKYGLIKQIFIGNLPNSTFADIAFKTPTSAAAAILDNGKIKVDNRVVLVTKRVQGKDAAKKKQGGERSIYVRNVNENTTESQIRELFEPCGEIENIKLSPAKDGTTLFALITFTKRAALEEALKLHYTVLNNSNLKVFECDVYRENRQYEADLTIMLRNKQELSSIEVSKLESIFSKCGEIDYVEVICRKQILAFITFKTKEAAEKALKMNGKTVQDVELELEAYSPFKKWTSIHILNVPKICTEADLRTHFAKAGEIASVTLKGTAADIRFEDSDGFCKSFLFNESFLKGHMIFIEPHSNRKFKVLNKINHYNNFKQNFKRPFENGKSSFKGKKAKLTE